MVDRGGRILVFPSLPADKDDPHCPGAGVLRPLVDRWGKLIQRLPLPALRAWAYRSSKTGLIWAKAADKPSDGVDTRSSPLSMADEPVPP